MEHHIEFRWREDASVEGICRNCQIGFSSNPIPSADWAALPEAERRRSEWVAVRLAQNTIRAEFWWPCPGKPSPVTVVVHEA